METNNKCGKTLSDPVKAKSTTYADELDNLVRLLFRRSVILFHIFLAPGVTFYE
jgi:hypothetical protein